MDGYEKTDEGKNTLHSSIYEERAMQGKEKVVPLRSKFSSIKNSNNYIPWSTNRE